MSNAVAECDDQDLSTSKDGIEPDANNGLPHIGNSPFRLSHDNDPLFFHDDTAETITINDSDESELIPDNSILYPNQEEDPENRWLFLEE